MEEALRQGGFAIALVVALGVLRVVYRDNRAERNDNRAEREEWRSTIRGISKELAASNGDLRGAIVESTAVTRELNAAIQAQGIRPRRATGQHAP